MLYNPQWDPLTLASFRAFCERQPAARRYRYNHKHCCAVGQWLTASDRETMIADDWGYNPLLYAVDRIACSSPRTFGALASRLRRYESTSSVPF